MTLHPCFSRGHGSNRSGLALEVRWRHDRLSTRRSTRRNCCNRINSNMDKRQCNGWNTSHCAGWNNVACGIEPNEAACIGEFSIHSCSMDQSNISAEYSCMGCSAWTVLHSKFLALADVTHWEVDDWKHGKLHNNRACSERSSFHTTTKMGSHHYNLRQDNTQCVC